MRSNALLLVVLFFGLLLQAYGVPMASAEADGPDYWGVRGVSHDDNLNLRKGPSVRFSVMAHIPSGFMYLENLGCSPEFTMAEWGSFSESEREVASTLRWCRVRFHEYVGWVKGSYLQEGLSPGE